MKIVLENNTFPKEKEILIRALVENEDWRTVAPLTKAQEAIAEENCAPSNSIDW